MGADLIVSVVWAHKDSTIDWSKAHQAIDEIDNDSDTWDYSYFPDRDPEDADAEVTDARHQAHADLDTLKAVWEGDFRRDAAILTIGKYRILITGGMSWGDSPTELSEILDRLVSLNVIQYAGFYPED